MVNVSPIVRRPLSTEDLEYKMKTGGYGGVIITSSFTISCLPKSLVEELANIGGPTFVVGKKTAEAARQAGFQQLIGEEIGSTAELSPILSGWQAEKEEEKVLPRLLFPGARTRARGLAELPAIDEVAVYETVAREESVLAAEIMAHVPFDVAVFFSPSGVKAAHDIVARQKTTMMIALGLTTAKSFPDGSDVSASSKPTAEGVFAAIEEALHAYST